MTKEDINCLCNFQSIYNTKEEKIYFIGMIYRDRDGRVIPVCDSTDFFSGKNLTLRDLDLLKDEWSYSVPYEE
jgi:hypothetical protein